MPTSQIAKHHPLGAPAGGEGEDRAAFGTVYVDAETAR